MTIKTQFAEPKDPYDDDWFSFVVDEDLASITMMTFIESDADIAPPGDAKTYGDMDTPGTPLYVYSWSLAADKRTIFFRVRGGEPGKTYAITGELIKAGASGGIVYRSCLLLVTGL